MNIYKTYMFNLKNILRIFTHDLNNVRKNWVALVIIGGLVFLPSLYAWLNIYASWDPYGQTDRIPVAIVNEDEGETVRGEDIDVGGDLVDTLKDDDSMDWQFLEQDEAMDELEKGDLFATVIIPKNFSENLGSVIQEQPEKASVEYYVNEKLNAIAPKITEKGASVIVEDISNNFISTVNGVIFDMFNDIGIKLEEDLPDIKRFENYVFDIEEKMPDIHTLLYESLTDARSAQGILSKAKDNIPTAERVIEEGLHMVDEAGDIIQTAEEKISDISPEFKSHLEKAQDITTELDGFIEHIETDVVDFTKSEQLKEKLTEYLNESHEHLETIEETFEMLINQLKESEDLDEDLIAQL